MADSLSLLDHVQSLQDPRLERCRKHQLADIIFLSICAMTSGAETFVAIEKFGHQRSDWLRKYVELANGIPSHDTIGRVFSLLDAQQFIDWFVDWVQSAHEVTAGEIVSIDGKTARASLDRSKGKSPLHVVSAWVSAQRVVLGQVMVDEKSNEIPAIPKLLEMLEIRGAIVTIDAMGCQKEIAAKIRERGADYVLPVKGNQEHLEEDIIDYFAAIDEGKCQPKQRSRCDSEGNGHGRKEMRFYDAVPVPPSLRHREEWKDLKSICRATRVWTENGVDKSEVRYFISSLPADAKTLSEAIRGHWGVENGLHWVLDMYFGEDKSRIRLDHAAANMAILRRWVLNLLTKDNTLKGGTATKRLQIGWNVRLLERLLGLW